MSSTLAKSTLAAVPRGLRRPVHVIPGHGVTAALKDKDNHTLFVSSLGVCRMVETALNAFPKLNADLAIMQVCLKDLRTELRAQPRTPIVAKLLALVDVGLAETSEHPEMGPL
jgi:hypothetical protein